jgi:hypothetical protein
MAERVAPDDGEQLYPFLCTSCWGPSPPERTLAAKAQQMVGGSGEGGWGQVFLRA